MDGMYANAPQMGGGMTTQDQGQLDPRLVQAILALQQQQGQQASLQRQRAMADRLRADSSQLQGMQSGRMYTPPTWANVAAHIAQQLRAKQMSDDADVRERNMGTQRSSAIEDYYNALINRRRAPLGHMGDEGE